MYYPFTLRSPTREVTLWALWRKETRHGDWEYNDEDYFRRGSDETMKGLFATRELAQEALEDYNRGLCFAIDEGELDEIRHGLYLGWDDHCTLPPGPFADWCLEVGLEFTGGTDPDTDPGLALKDLFDWLEDEGPSWSQAQRDHLDRVLQNALGELREQVCLVPAEPDSLSSEPTSTKEQPG